MQIPSVTKDQMIKVDKYATEFFGVEIVQLMENAGRNIASFAKQQLRNVEYKKIAILCGKGNNGGDGLVAARFLHNWGADITCIIADNKDNLSKLTNDNFGTLRSMYVNVLWPIDNVKFEKAIRDSNLVIDALFGYNIKDNPQGTYAFLIELANNSNKNILAVDIPSGLDPDTGNAYEPCIKAKWTLALGLPKAGMLQKNAKEFVGELWLADIGIPKEVYTKLEMNVPNIFRDKEIVRVS
jgi:NAD(P)H-hydrate epimerase